MTLRWLGEAKIGPDAPHAVQLTCLGPKKPILRPLVQNLIFSHGMTLMEMMMNMVMMAMMPMMPMKMRIFSLIKDGLYTNFRGSDDL